MSRPTKDEWALGVATAVATRAECTRRKVGAVITQDGRTVGTGYNGAPKGKPSCLDGACPRGLSDVPSNSQYDSGPGLCIAIHAEANALLHTNRADLVDATLYCTDEPCVSCARLIAGSGVKRVVWPTGDSVHR